MDWDKATALKNELKEKIKVFDRDFLNKFPIEIYIKYLEKYPTVISYQYVSPEIKKICENIVKTSNENILELYHKLVSVSLIIHNKDKLTTLKLPDEIKYLFYQNFDRIIDNITQNTFPPGFYLYSNDKFYKDIGVCSLRLIPAGPAKINISSLPANFLFKGGIKQFVRGILFILFELRGFKPIYEMHVDSHDPNALAEYTYEGHVRFYKRIAQIFMINRNIKAIIAIGWPFDPQIEKISPRHKYLRDFVIKNGGKIFYVGPSESAINNAILRSPTRRKLYEEGKYIPTDYLMIWPRKKLIQWANKQNNKLNNL
jgi:hypothetical protein